MKPSVDKGNRQSWALGLVLAVAFLVFEPSAPLVYGISLAAIGLLVWVHLGPPEGHPLRYLRRRS